jgi:two-component system, OmpR family, phosphate regulon sensor histidine kinase PhoR
MVPPPSECYNAATRNPMTVRSPIFRKLLLSAAVLIVLPLLMLDFYLTRLTAQREVARTEAQLAAQARILVGEAAAVPAPELQRWAYGAQQRAQTRVTIIGPNGSVLADSEHDPESMENHGERPEVRQAFAGRMGSAVRHSATLGRDLTYLALPLTYEGRSGFVLRLALPVREIDSTIVEVRWHIVGASIFAAALAIIAAYLFSRSLTRRVRRIQSFAETLHAGKFSEEITSDADDELGELATSLTHMAREMRDMVERLSLESARREAILTSMVEGVLVVDKELRVTFVNESFAKSVGSRYPIPERLPLLELLLDPGLLKMLTRALVTGSPARQRLALAAAPGRGFEVQVSPLAPSRRGAVAILHDITELERLERVRKDFVANVSHELRTPLTAIRGYAETLLDGALEDQENNRKFLEIIRAHTIRLNNIASDLLVLSELESGQPAPEPERISIQNALETAMRTVEPEAEDRAVHLVRDNIEEAFVRGHRIRLEQALVNLLDNATKFNRPGGEVRARAEKTPEGTVRITISDTGIGIPSDDLPRIFERFYRVDKARSREVGGTGLGLSIVRHVIERMGGAVTVDSQLGKGSTFSILLPVLN